MTKQFVTLKKVIKQYFVLLKLDILQNTVLSRRECFENEALLRGGRDGRMNQICNNYTHAISLGISQLQISDNGGQSGN